MTKIKLLYDIEQLLVSKNKETGICRVSLEVLKRISKETSYDVYPIVTTDKGENVREYLTRKGLNHLLDKIVYLPILSKTTQNYKFSKRIRSFLLTQKYRKKYLQELNKYDEYISIFSPISPTVYQSTLKTKIVVHDLIPLIMPETCIQKSFPQKYARWIKAIRTDEVICVSKATKTDLFKIRPDLDKSVKVVYLAADKKFKPTRDDSIYKKYKIPTKKYFLAASDFNPRKNLIHLIDAFILFLERNKTKDISLVLAGPKSDGFVRLEKHLENISKYKDKIVFTDFVDDKDMPALYTMAQAFIYPSLYEGFGLPLLEAMQCGVPVITCKNSSLPEVCGNAAVYVSGHKIEETVHALRTLAQNNTVRKRLIKLGFERAKMFSWDKTVNNIFNTNMKGK